MTPQLLGLLYQKKKLLGLLKYMQIADTSNNCGTTEYISSIFFLSSNFIRFFSLFFSFPFFSLCSLFFLGFLVVDSVAWACWFGLVDLGVVVDWFRLALGLVVCRSRCGGLGLRCRDRPGVVAWACAAEIGLGWWVCAGFGCLPRLTNSRTCSWVDLKWVLVALG